MKANLNHIKVIFLLFIGFYSLNGLGNPQQCRKAYKNHLLVKQKLITTSDPRLRELIESNGKILHKNGFHTLRTLQDYMALFQEFPRVIEQLKPEEAILDSGCGDSFLSDSFFPQYTTKNEFDPYGFWSAFTRARLLPPTFSFSHNLNGPTYIGVTKELKTRTIDDFKDRIDSGRFRLLTNRYFEEYTDHELKQGNVIKVITDFYGVLSYSERPDIVLQTYLRILDKNGMIFIGGSPAIQGENIQNFLHFISSIEGIDISRRAVYINNELVEGYTITPKKYPIKIPELKYITSREDMPPTRYYQKTGKKLIVKKLAN